MEHLHHLNINVIQCKNITILLILGVSLSFLHFYEEVDHIFVVEACRDMKRCRHFIVQRINPSVVLNQELHTPTNNNKKIHVCNHLRNISNFCPDYLI